MFPESRRNWNKGAQRGVASKKGRKGGRNGGNFCGLFWRRNKVFALMAGELFHICARKENELQIADVVVLVVNTHNT